MPLLVQFVGGDAGPWRIDGIGAVKGAALSPAERLAMREDGVAAPGAWALRGTTSNAR